MKALGMTENKGLRVLSLFDGMGCGYAALKRAGIAVSKYHAYEVDKYAIQIAKKNHPEIIHHGEITFMTDFTQFAGFDLLIGGSPCQGFSAAGKGLNFSDSRSQLFFEFVRAKREVKPKYFMLENVKMKKEWLDIISEQLGVEPVCINSALVSAQNRVRYYWCNWDVGQPEDRGLVLRDIIEDGAVDREKSYCIDANYYKGGNPKSYFEKRRRQLVSVKIGEIKNGGICNRVYSPEGKSICLTSQSGGTAGNGSMLIGTRCAQIVGRKINPETGKRDDRNPDLQAEQRLEIRGDEKTGCLTGVQKDNVLTNGITYRKLTPIECERLQTVPDDYTHGVSSSQRYKMLGNGWTVDVIAHILRNMPL